jgi:hypothetical protein
MHGSYHIGFNTVSQTELHLTLIVHSTKIYVQYICRKLITVHQELTSSIFHRQLLRLYTLIIRAYSIERTAKNFLFLVLVELSATLFMK